MAEKVDTHLNDAQEEFRRAVVDALRNGFHVVPEDAAKAILASSGIAVPSGVVVDELAGLPACNHLSRPLVVKAISSTLVHKSDVGGVRVGIGSDAALHEALIAIQRDVGAAGHALNGWLVEEMAPEGLELVLGAVKSTELGWSVMLGLGGVFVEILGDVSFGLAPLERRDVEEMLGELKAGALLEGHRGSPRVDRAALIDLVLAVAGEGGLLEDLPNAVVEVDLNPILAGPNGCVAVDARFVLDATADHRRPTTAVAGGKSLHALFEPESIAVLGASSRGANMANLFIRNLQKFGFKGPIVPVHPTADFVEGLPAVPSLAEVSNFVDYAYISLPAAAVPAALKHGGGKLAFAQVVSSGFAEVPEGVELERDLLTSAQDAGIRVLGPNCLGTHSPAGRLTFVPDAPTDAGPVAVVSQSGGLSVDILRLGSRRGVSFHSVTSVGNSADLGPCEIVQHLMADERVQVIGLYLESLKAGRELVLALKNCNTRKPIVLLAGGRTDDGSAAALSHTGAMVSNHRLWPALARQGHLHLVDTVHEFVDVLAGLQLSRAPGAPRNGNVLLFGNGGGTSVLAADAFSRRGLRTSRLPDTTVAELEALGLPPGNGLANPIDTPAGTLFINDGAVAEEILRIAFGPRTHAVAVVHINVGVIANNSTSSRDVVEVIVDAVVRAARGARDSPHVLLVLRSDGDPGTDERIRHYARISRSSGIPVYGELVEAAAVAMALIEHNNWTRELSGMGETDES